MAPCKSRNRRKIATPRLGTRRPKGSDMQPTRYAKSKPSLVSPGTTQARMAVSDVHLERLYKHPCLTANCMEATWTRC